MSESSGSDVRNPTAGLAVNQLSSGMIVLWPLPFNQGVYPELNGWLLCDGTNGTPDMRGYFARGTPLGGCSIMQQGDTCPECASAIGGADTHMHTCTLTKIYDNCCDFSRCLDVVTDILASNHLPPFKHFNFIMRL